ncbi:peptide-N(4)-(N-acetyl-beta-glucosaminyl)asparagine amidase-like [Actinia tenebrosa]|uniref:Peptide-N(4)-(N-acetyl-beta-glucosaminyl)asparagine amidase n=1 Tax=Actinia tenebrosa TaxID=6105 RepID=A0A6P8HB87_ACTTE|nr:peptide-N(4)-(N-acetyl-beta-glucosaminyl)asparagine amidase-like [Actinia tenebrosa]
MASNFGNGNVIVVKDDSLFDIEMDRAGKRLVVVDFTASWCGPCQRIAPVFMQLSMKYMSVVFLKVDVDQCPFTAESRGIRAMPTFHFYKNKNKITELKGSDPLTLEKKIQELSTSEDNNFIPDPKRVSTGRSWSCFKELQANEDNVFMDISQIILKFANNIIKYPENQKYRSIRIGNKIFQEKLLPVMGGVECLFAMGFEEQDDHLVFPTTTSIDALITLRDTIQDERMRKTSKNVQVSACSGLTLPSSSQETKQNVPNNTEKIPLSPTSNGMTVSQMQFYAKLKSSLDHVMIYEDLDLQRRACAMIPVEDLESKAHSMSQKSKDGQNKGIDVRDCLILALLHWFKNEFFQWVDKPYCDSCKVVGQFQGNVAPTSDEEYWGAGTVENYRCPKCQHDIRFPRYNHPTKLLETRRGRCGEWANCFTLLCRTLGYEARHVVDWTDHVWTEIFSESQQRWLHCDSCEGICDKPLLYEAGWGKKLSYVIAFSRDEVFDVTWRYSGNHDLVRHRRKEVPEQWLLNTTMKMTEQLQKDYPQERRQMLQTRTITELFEIMTSKKATEEELQGRTSGSLAWRRIRGELGVDSDNKFSPYVFKPTPKEIADKRIRIRYCPALDGYYRCPDNRISADTSSDIAGWKNGASAVESVFRKVENDWKMVYLTRNEGSELGSISWKVDLTSSDHIIDAVTIVATSSTFENGKVDWMVYGDDVERQCSVLNGGSAPQTLHSLCGSKTLTLTARLSGGIGDVAWQHAQLFRQSVLIHDEYPLQIDIKIKPAQ